MRNLIQSILNKYPETEIAPREFFIAWQGVPTIAYKGFTQTLLSLKRELKNQIPGLQNENPGSIWPKSSLGALNNSVILDHNELLTIKEICNSFNSKLGEIKPIPIKSLSVVIFQCRSLEKRLITNEISFNLNKAKNNLIPDNHIEDVNRVLEQFSESNLLNYLTYVNKNGNKILDYKKDYIESTLVFDLPANCHLIQVIEQFQKKVDCNFPEYFTWFDKSSLHLTIRALN